MRRRSNYYIKRIRRKQASLLFILGAFIILILLTALPGLAQAQIEAVNVPTVTPGSGITLGPALIKEATKGSIIAGQEITLTLINARLSSVTWDVYNGDTPPEGVGAWVYIPASADGERNTIKEITLVSQDPGSVTVRVEGVQPGDRACLAVFVSGDSSAGGCEVNNSGEIKIKLSSASVAEFEESEVVVAEAVDTAIYSNEALTAIGDTDDNILSGKFEHIRTPLDGRDIHKNRESTLPTSEMIAEKTNSSDTSTDSLDNWQLRNKGNLFNAVTYGNGTFVAVGPYGKILTSPDGITWTERDSGTSRYLNGVAFGNGTFVVVGDYGKILTSPDGATWTVRDSGISYELYGITYGNAIFVAVGYEGIVLTSPDGLTWAESMSGHDWWFIYAVTYGNGVYVAVGENINGGAIWTSPDGATWTMRISYDNEFYSVTYGNDCFVAVGHWGTVLTSHDGITWTEMNSGTYANLKGVTYNNGTFVAVGHDWYKDVGIILTSPDGETWAERTSGTYFGLTAATCGNGNFVVVGQYGTILTSSDGATWAENIHGTGYELRGVTYGNGTIVAVGDDTILSSPDGIIWTERSSGTYDDLYGVTYAAGTFVTGGYSRSNFENAILTSPNGATWTMRHPGGDDKFFAIAYGNSTFVAVGWDGEIRTSSDTITWTRRNSGCDEYLHDITYGNSTFVVVGSRGTVLTSPDGMTWTERISGTDDWLHGVVYAADIFVAVGMDSIFTSPDGITWTERFSTYGFYDIAYGNSTFVAVGERGKIFTSPDGITWTTRTSGVTDELYGITYANGAFVAVGESGTILQYGVVGPPDPASITIKGVTEGATVSAKTNLTATVTGVELTKVYYYLVGQDKTQYAVGESYNPADNWQVELDPAMYADGPYELAAAGIRQDNGEPVWGVSVNINVASKSTDSLDNWRLRNLSWHLYGVTYANDTFVAVGSYTGITSPDGINWTANNINRRSNGITYGNGIFVAVGGEGTILTSPDGISWTTRTSGTSEGLYGVTYNNAIFVAVGYDGTILTSPDGINWTARNSGVTNALKGVTYGNSIFVAVGEKGTILTSSDGISWTARNSGVTNALNGVTYGNGIFVVVGYHDILTSSDGTSWTDRNSEGYRYLYGVTYGNSTFVAVGDNGEILTSPDGISWTDRNSGKYRYLYGVTYGNGIFVAVGEEGTILTSPDGIGWTVRSSYTSADLYGVTYGSSAFVAVGDTGKILTSPDGISWTNRSSGTTGKLYSVTYGNSTFVAVGYGSKILTSPDGVNWTARSSSISFLNDEYHGVTYGNGAFVVVGEGAVLTSPDGITWTNRTTWVTNRNFQDVTYGNSTFVAVGDNGTILNSPDGISWTARTSGTSEGLYGVTYGNGIFIAVGYDGTILTSPDGISWTNRISGTSEWLRDVTYGHDDAFVAVGWSDTILTSSDGIKWTAKSSNTHAEHNGVAFGNGTFVAVGWGGTILQSGVVGSIASLTINGVTEGVTVSAKTTLTATVNGAELTKVYYYLVDQSEKMYNIGESFNSADNWQVELDPSKYPDGPYELAAAGIRQDNGEPVYASTINITLHFQTVESDFKFANINNQAVGVPFEISITRVDDLRNTLTDFNGILELHTNSGAFVSPTKVEMINGCWTGNISLDLPGNDVNITAVCSGDYGVSNNFDVTGIQEFCNLHGVAKYQDSIVTGATVYLNRGESSEIVTVTDANGRFTFEDLEPGVYTIESVLDVSDSSTVSTNVYSNDITKVASSNSSNKLYSDKKSTLINKKQQTEDITMYSENKPIVLFLPGIMGSTLKGEQPGLCENPCKNDPHCPYGDSMYYLRGNPILDEKVPAKKEDIEIVSVNLKFGWPYKGIIDKLTEAGYEVVKVPYDWRMDLNDCWNTYLKPVINTYKKKSSTSKVDVVAHSMGGLVTRSYIQSQSYGDDIDKFAMLATPNAGYTGMYYLYEKGDPGALGKVANTSLYKDLLEELYLRMKGKPLPNNKNEIKDFIRANIKTVKQMMPTYQYITQLDEAGKEHWPEASSEFLDDLNNKDEDFYRMTTWLDNSDSSKVRTMLYLSNEKDTISRIYIDSKGKIIKCSKSLDGNDNVKTKGDNTVICEKSSEACSQVTPSKGSYGEHTDVPGDEDVKDLVLAFLNSGRTVSQGSNLEKQLLMQSLTSSQEPERTVTINITGRVQPYVVDSYGNGSGVNHITGEYEENIPGSTVMLNISSSSISINNPGIGTYNIYLKGSVEDTFLVKITYLDGERFIERKAYGIYHGGILSFSFIIDEASKDKVTLVSPVEPPVKVKAEENSGMTMLSWQEFTDNSVAYYKIYGRSDEQPLYTLLGTTEGNSFNTGIPWNQGGEKSWCFVVTSESADGKESFFDSPVENREYVVADFVTNKTSGDCPLNVEFTDLSTGNVTSWEWDFDSDGVTDSTDKNPAYTFNAPGIYTVMLSVDGPDGADYKTAFYYITVFDPTISKVEIIGTDPIDNASNVSLDKNITITFNETINVGLNYDGIELRDAEGSVLDLTCSIAGNELTIIPNMDLNYGDKYTVYIPATSVVSATYGTYNGEFISSFTTIGYTGGNSGISGSFTFQVAPESTNIPQAEVSLWTAGADRATAEPVLTQNVDITATAGDNNGIFQLTSLQPGSYDITFKLPYSLRAMAANVTITQDAITPVNFGEIILGDTWGEEGPDNVVDVSDYSAILYSFGTVPGDDKYIDTCDLNRDGVVDVTDYSIVLYNFGEYGEAPY
jgi:PKD repeat protein